MTTRLIAPPARLQPTRLRRLRFFRELSPDEARQVAGIGLLASYGPGECLATEETRKQRRTLYVVLSGSLQYVKRIRTERAGVVLTLGPGDVGGFLTLWNDGPSPVTVRSRGRTRVFEIGRQELEALAASHPALAAKLLRMLAEETARHLGHLVERMAATSAWALDLVSHVEAYPLDMNG